MTRTPFKRIRTLLFALAACLLATGPGAAQRAGDQSIEPPADLNIPSPEQRSPQEALKSFVLEEGFEIQLVAAEPLVIDPVCMAWDADGKLWVCEMRGYMPDIKGTGEDEPTGQIVVLEDIDGDGKMDKRTVFLDNLVLPRAIAFVKGGILFADHEKLVEVKMYSDGAAGAKMTRDPRYSNDRGGKSNVEHQANGLLYGLDNWYYSARSSWRYQKSGGRLRPDRTDLRRGQWGISQDDDGHLLYNSNSVPMLYELFPPNATKRNPNYDFKSNVLNRAVVRTSKEVYPVRPTPLANRAYNPGVVSHETWKLKQFTAACGPVIYRGSQFPDDYYNNVFIPDPVGLLVKRVVIEDNGTDKPTAKHAYKGKEFLASTDERSRIVNAYVGPDGCLYLVDMYRGIIQHKTYLSNYLKREIRKNGLDKEAKPMGRIYRVVRKGKPVDHSPPMLSKKSPAELVALLGHKNAWQRQTAQRLLVQQKAFDSIKPLKLLAKTSPNTQARIHALWALEGMRQLTPEVLIEAGKAEDPQLWRHVLRLAEQFAEDPDAETKPKLRFLVGHLKRYEAHSAKTPNWKLDLQIAFSGGVLAGLDTPEAYDVLVSLLKRRGDDPLFRAAIVSGLKGKEAVMLEKVTGPILKDLGEAMSNAVENGNMTVGALLKIIDKPEHAERRPDLLANLATQAVEQNRSEVLKNLTERMADPKMQDQTRFKIFKAMVDAREYRNTPPEIDGMPQLFKDWVASPPKQWVEQDLITEDELKDLMTRLEEGKLFAFEIASISAELAARFKNGAEVYSARCETCHGDKGQGKEQNAPPLRASEWVSGSPRMLASIALVGIAGDIKVGNKVYKAGSDIALNMPGLREVFTPDPKDPSRDPEQELADLLTFIRSKNFDNTGDPVSKELVSEVRKKLINRAEMFTPKQAWAINVADGGTDEAFVDVSQAKGAKLQHAGWLKHSNRNLVLTLVAVTVPLVLLLLATVFGSRSEPIEPAH